MNEQFTIDVGSFDRPIHAPQLRLPHSLSHEGTKHEPGG